MMKKLRFIPMVFAVSMLLTTLSCSVDQPVNAGDVTLETSEALDSKAPINTVVTIVIEWHEGVKKGQKSQVRDRYKDEGILVSYVECEEDDRYEEWEINCEEGLCSRQSDTPVDTDDDVKRLYFEITCVDVKK